MTDEAVSADLTTTGHRPRWKRDTGVFLTGQTVSMFGSMLVQYAIMWYLTIATESGVVLMLSAIFGMLPQAIVSIFGGVWADRLNRKRLIIIADASIAATTLALALFMLAGYTELWLIFLTLAIRSTGAGIQQPAVAALIPQLVPTPHLLRVNGIFQSISSAMMLIAPAAAGGIYAGAAAAWGPDSAMIPIFFIDVVTAVIGIGFLLAIAVPTVRTVVDTGYFADLAKGVTYTFSHRFVRWLLALFAVIFILTVAPSMLTPLMVVRSFGSDAPSDVWLLTVNELAFSIGMLLGGILIATWGGLKNKVVMLIASSVLFGVLTLALGLSTNVWVFFGFMFLVGLAVPFFSTPATTLLQERVEVEFQGRVFGFVGVVMATAMPIGMVLFGPLADVIPVEWVLIGAGIATFVVIGIAILVPSGRQALAAGADAPTTADEAEPAQTGPSERPRSS